MKKLGPLVFFIVVFVGCTWSLNTGRHYANEQLPLTIDLPGDQTTDAKKPKLSSFTRKRFQQYAAALGEESDKEILFYSGGNDNPDKIPYTAIGTVIPALDTTKVKEKGFANRKINTQPYLHKTTIDKSKRIVSSEYIVKLPDKYFYLFASAPITRAILHNEEAMIVVQDSLNRKYSAAIGSLQVK